MHINKDLNKMSKQKFNSTRVIIHCGSIILTVKSEFVCRQNFACDAQFALFISIFHSKIETTR